MRSGGNDHAATRRQRALLSGTFAVLAILTFGTGVYFMTLRPPLLPEDVLFTGMTITAAPQGLLDWLSIVFRTWGGFLVGFGLCLAGCSAWFWGRREAWLRMGLGAGVLVAFGSFLASNLQLHSDFLWFIAVLFVAAVSGGILLVSVPLGRPSER